MCGNRLNCWNTMPTSRRTMSMVLRIIVEKGAVDHDAALLVGFEMVDAADQRRFAGAGRSAQDDLLACADRQIDVDFNA